MAKQLAADLLTDRLVGIIVGASDADVKGCGLCRRIPTSTTAATSFQCKARPTFDERNLRPGEIRPEEPYDHSPDAEKIDE